MRGNKSFLGLGVAFGIVWILFTTMATLFGAILGTPWLELLDSYWSALLIGACVMVTSLLLYFISYLFDNDVKGEQHE